MKPSVHIHAKSVWHPCFSTLMISLVHPYNVRIEEAHARLIVIMMSALPTSNTNKGHEHLLDLSNRSPTNPLRNHHLADLQTSLELQSTGFRQAAAADLQSKDLRWGQHWEPWPAMARDPQGWDKWGIVGISTNKKWGKFMDGPMTRRIFT